VYSSFLAELFTDLLSFHSEKITALFALFPDQGLTTEATGKTQMQSQRL